MQPLHERADATAVRRLASRCGEGGKDAVELSPECVHRLLSWFSDWTLETAISKFISSANTLQMYVFLRPVATNCAPINRPLQAAYQLGFFSIHAMMRRNWLPIYSADQLQQLDTSLERQRMIELLVNELQSMD